MTYTEGFKAQMVRRMMEPGGVTAAALARKVGVPQPTLSGWLRRASNSVALVSDRDERKAPPAGKAKTWTVAEKLRVLAAAQGLQDEALGALLRREGLHEAELMAWGDAAAGVLGTSAKAAPSSAVASADRRKLKDSEKRVKELERELRRKEKALAEAAALLFLEKKLQAMGWDRRHETGGAGEDGAPDERTDE
jgi:transposase